MKNQQIESMKPRTYSPLPIWSVEDTGLNIEVIVNDKCKPSSSTWTLRKHHFHLHTGIGFRIPLKFHPASASTEALEAVLVLHGRYIS